MVIRSPEPEWYGGPAVRIGLMFLKFMRDGRKERENVERRERKRCEK
jgi:hypothetical protein